MAARCLIQKDRQNGGLSETIQSCFLAKGNMRPDAEDRQNGGMSETILKLFLANGSTERQTKWRPVRNYSEAVPGHTQHST
jgi:hypothetical protein